MRTFGFKHSAFITAVFITAGFACVLNAQEPRPDGPPQARYVNVVQVDFYLKNVKSTDAGGGAEFYVYPKTATIVTEFSPDKFAGDVVSSGAANIDVKHGTSKNIDTSHFLLSDINQPNYKQERQYAVLKINGTMWEDDNSGDAELKGPKELRVKIPDSLQGKSVISHQNPSKVDIEFINQYVTDLMPIGLTSKARRNFLRNSLLEKSGP